VNYDALQTYTEQFATLQQLRFDDFQDLLAGHPPQPDPNLMMQMQLQMMQAQQPPLGPLQQQQQQQPPVEPSSPQPPPEDPAAAAKARAAVDAMERYTPPAAWGSTALAAPSGSRPTTAVSPEYREALDAALNDLPKVFVAKGEKGKSHKVRLWRLTVGLGALPRSPPRGKV
jgi:hypothetical protein